MLYTPSTLAIIVFCSFVGVTLGLSFWLGRKAKSSAGYFAAHGQIPWFVNGVAFAGDYLSAASFLGICGMIAFYGYDGFLYSIGFLAGWIVALFVIAEPMKRLGKFTFADALDAKFGSRGIKLAAGVSTLVVSLFYLIPQMVGAGTLVKPLLGLDHWVGVVLVGTVVILIVVTAGMVSTTWVQFIKGALLVVLCGFMTLMILGRGLATHARFPDRSESVGAHRDFSQGERLPLPEGWPADRFERIRKSDDGRVIVRIEDGELNNVLCQTVKVVDGVKLVNGLPQKVGVNDLEPVGEIWTLKGYDGVTGVVDPLQYLSAIQNSDIVVWSTVKLVDDDGLPISIYYPQVKKGADLLVPGGSPTFAGIRSGKLADKLDFISLMMALFAGTASLPHILIRYYTVKDAHAARLSTVVGILTIGFFYILTLYLGLSAMTSLVLDPTDVNMAAPLLAKSFGDFMFAAISAVAFTTVLGTVSGLILAASGAVAHDLLAHGFGVKMTDHQQITYAKMSAVVVGIIGIGLGIVFKDFSVSFLVGWAFNIAASANLPSLIMLLFWPKTTKQGIIAAVLVGMFSSLTWVLVSGDAFSKLYGLKATDALVPFSQPGIVTIPLGFLTVVLVSLMTQPSRPSQVQPT